MAAAALPVGSGSYLKRAESVQSKYEWTFNNASQTLLRRGGTLAVFCYVVVHWGSWGRWGRCPVCDMARSRDPCVRLGRRCPHGAYVQPHHEHPDAKGGGARQHQAPLGGGWRVQGGHIWTRGHRGSSGMPCLFTHAVVLTCPHPAACYETLTVSMELELVFVI